MLKNTVKAILLFAMLLSVFSACTQQNEEFNTEFDTSGDTVDLDRFDFTYAISSAEGSVLAYQQDSLFADLVLKRIADIESTYNAKIIVKYDAEPANIVSSVVSDSFYCDAFMGLSPVWQIRGGYFIGLSTLSDYIDCRDTFKWGTPNMLEAFFWEDDLYCLLPASWPELLFGNSGYPVLVNERLIDTLGLIDPREYAENKTWSWDIFEDFISSATVNLNGTQIYGVSVHPPYFGEMFLRSNGDKMIEKDANGNYVCGWYTDTALKAMQRGQDMFVRTHKDCFYPAWDNGSNTNAFLNGESVLYPTWSFYVVGQEALSFRTEDPLGLVPFPYGPDADPDVYTSVYEGLSYAIAFPVNTREPDAAAIMINAIYEPLEGYETEQDIKDYLSRYAFYDPRDTEVFYNMFVNTQYAFYSEGARVMSESITENKSITQLLESYKSTYDSLLDKFFIPTQRGIEAVWGE